MITRYYSFFILVFVISCRSSDDIKSIKKGDYILEGGIWVKGNDTILNGEVRTYRIGDGKLLAKATYKQNKKDGELVEYYDNGKVFSRSEFVNDIQSGATMVLDSNGAKLQQSYFYYGLPVGPVIDYKNSKESKFRFITFDGIELYNCEYKSPDQILEQGRLLNYSINSFLDENQLRLSIFLYLISPPHKKLTYNIFDKNIKTGDSLLVFSWAYDSIPFKKFTLDVPKEGHEYLWDIEAFYPFQGTRIKNILSQRDRSLEIKKSR